MFKPVPAPAAAAPAMAYAGPPPSAAAVRFGIVSVDDAVAAWDAVPPPAVDVAPAPHHDGRLLHRRALLLVVASIALGGVMQFASYLLSRSHSIEPEALIRYDLVLTLVLYAGVTVLIVRQITTSVRLRWGEGPALGRVALGASIGAVVALLLLGLVSAASGHLQSDPRIALLLSEADPTHILVVVLIACVAAPLVEETLFRGLFLESLLPRGSRFAIVASAAAFAVWHFMPASLVYYTVLGAALGKLYQKRGLTASVAAHVGFNGVLTIAAIMMVLGPSRVVSVGSVTLTEPSGWSQRDATGQGLPVTNLYLVGPSGAELDVAPGPEVGDVGPSQIIDRLRTLPLLPGGDLTTDSGSIRQVDVPLGVVVEEDVTYGGRAGTIAFVTADGQLDELVFFGAGSARAQRDFTTILNSMR